MNSFICSLAFLGEEHAWSFFFCRLVTFLHKRLKTRVQQSVGKYERFCIVNRTYGLVVKQER